VARYAWVPARFTPFLGAGVGVLWYRLEQEGDFVERGTNDIFFNTYKSSGSALAAQAMAGAEYWVIPALALTAEARYTHSSDAPSGDFNYDTVDLSGLQLSAGVSFRF
jgi:opacity protein-like surface antigen